MHNDIEKIIRQVVPGSWVSEDPSRDGRLATIHSPHEPTEYHIQRSVDKEALDDQLIRTLTSMVWVLAEGYIAAHRDKPWADWGSLVVLRRALYAALPESVVDLYVYPDRATVEVSFLEMSTGITLTQEAYDQSKGAVVIPIAREIIRKLLKAVVREGR